MTTHGSNAVEAFPSLGDLRGVSALFFFEGQYLFRHRTAKGKGVAKFLAPEAVRAAFTAERLDTGWLPPGVVRAGKGPDGDYAVLFSPPRAFTVGVLGDGAVRPLTVPLPGLVLAGYARNYRVCAVKGTAFSPNAIAYYPPLPNVYENTGICWGQAVPPVASAATMAAALELFLTTVFTPNETRFRRSHAFPGDIRACLEDLDARGADAYPEEDLVAVRSQGGPEAKSGPTVARLVEELVGSGGAS